MNLSRLLLAARPDEPRAKVGFTLRRLRWLESDHLLAGSYHRCRLQDGRPCGCGSRRGVPDGDGTFSGYRLCGAARAAMPGVARYSQRRSGPEISCAATCFRFRVDTTSDVPEKRAAQADQAITTADRIPMMGYWAMSWSELQ